MPNPGLNVIALISGGKDSLYSILHCIRNGHRVVALANLHPPDSQQQEQEDDMDSFMYQTIGHNIIPLYETALEIPLYRAPITGGAVDTARIYGNESIVSSATAAAADDETESLVPLLTCIKRDLPHANAVSAGAILSTYQRTRIENVAGRLGLVPLAWLWMYTELPRPAEEAETTVGSGLLEDMAAAGCEARIIKAASGGLDEGSLWENVSSRDGSVRRRLEKAMSRFAVEDLEQAVLGEGGEYETLALDGPGFLWKKRIVVEDEDRRVRSVGGGVCYSMINRAKCVSKDIGQSDIKPEDIRRPARLDGSFQRALELVKGGEVQTTATVHSTCQPLPTVNSHTASNKNSWTISNITAPEAGLEAGAQMHGISAKLQDILSQGVASSNPTTDDIVFTTILLRSMKDFAPMNDIYVSLFSKPNPPARVTVACGDCLPEGVQIMASFAIDLGARRLRKGLHVQSRSYWAPANIGPYSQAITVPCQLETPVESSGGLVFIAGQIPLDPPSMEIPRVGNGETTWYEDFGLHATLSLQHLWRIGRATQVDWWLGGIAFLARDDAQQRIRAKAQLAHTLWQKLNKPNDEEEEEEEDADLDVWDIKHGLREDPRPARRVQPLPNFDRVDIENNSNDAQITTPLFAVEVEALPRESDIEWQALGTTCCGVTLMKTVDTADPYARIWCTRLNSSSAVFYTIGFRKGSRQESLDERIDTVVSELQCDLSTSHATVYLAGGVGISRGRAQVVPCRSIWGEGGQEMAAVMTIRLSNS